MKDKKKKGSKHFNKKKSDVSKSDEELELLKAQLARTLADYDNLTKRVERERESQGDVEKVRLISSLLPAFDMLYDAQGHLNDQGLAITIQTLETSLSDQGIEKIDPKEGDDFDPEVHEAVDTQRVEGQKEGAIIRVSLTGWRLKDSTVIRHAKVVVNKN